MAMDPYLKRKILNNQPAEAEPKEENSEDKYSQEELEEMGVNENHDNVRNIFGKQHKVSD